METCSYFNRNLTIKDCVMAVGRASWKHFADRAKFLLSPDQVLEYHVSCADRRFWVGELLDIISASLFDARNLVRLMPQWSLCPEALEWHVDIFEKLLEGRAQSLTASHCMPPALYYHLLSPFPDVAMRAHSLAQEHFRALLGAEEAVAGGASVECLANIFWRLNPLIRCLFLAFEQDAAQRLALSADSKARRLMVVLSKHLGDSRVIENVHQHGRDLYRTSKASSFANPIIFANALASGVLQERNVPMVAVSGADKAMADAFQSKKREGIARRLLSQGHKLPRDMQQLMVPKSGAHTWPSPAPSSLFGSAASTAWLFAYYGQGSKLQEQCGVNSAWLSCLAKAGNLVAQRSAGRLVKVLASAEFGLFAVDMAVQHRLGGGRAFVPRTDRDAVQWLHVVDLKDWVVLQVQPCLVNPKTLLAGNQLEPLCLWKPCAALRVST